MIIFCYEKDRSGETTALNNLVKILKEKKKPPVKSFLADTFTDTEPLYLGKWMWTSLVYWLKILQREGGADWVITPTYAAGLAACFMKPFFKYRLCYCYYGNRIPPKYLQSTTKKKFANFFLYWLIMAMHRLVIFFADIVSVPSENTLSHLYEDIGLKRKITKAIVIPNGVDLKIFHPIGPEVSGQIRKKHGLSRKRIVIYAGRLHPQKGVLELIRAVGNLSKKIKDLHLMILHPPSFIYEETQYQKQLLKLVEELKINNISFLTTESLDLPGFYSCADVSVLPSKQDNFPLTGLESLASGCVCISTADSGLGPLLENISSDLVMKIPTPKNIAGALDYFLSLDQEEKNRLREKSLALVKKYSWEKAGDKFLTYFGRS